MTKRQFQLMRELREGVINRKSFLYLWGKEMTENVYDPGLYDAVRKLKRLKCKLQEE